MTDNETNGESENCSKDLVIMALTTEWPLSTQQLYKIVLKQRPEISYHAVHKACRQLLAQGVLKREKKVYSISSDWIVRLCEFLDKVKAGYAGQKAVVLPGIKEFREGEGRTFEFSNLEDADSYRKRLQWEYLMVEGTKKPYCAMSRHLRSPLFSSERALNIMSMATKAKSRAYMVVAGDTPIDRWSADYYRNEFVRVQTGVPCAEVCDTFVLGDIVVQLHLPDELRTRLETTYLNTENVSDLNVSGFYNEVYRRRATVKLTVMRNAEIAAQLHEQIMSHFKFNRVAVFDINGTLVDAYLITLFAEYLALNGKFDKSKLEQMMLLEKGQSKSDSSYERCISKTIELYAEGMNGQVVEEIAILAKRFVEEGRVPLFKASKRLFNWVNSHYKTVVITKTTEEIVKALEGVFSFDCILASQLEVAGGRYTGKLRLNLASKAGKGKAFKTWLKSAKADMHDSLAFGNTLHDFAFMEHVSKPILIGNPDAKSANIAKKRKWKVFSYDSDASDIIAAFGK